MYNKIILYFVALILAPLTLFYDPFGTIYSGDVLNTLEEAAALKIKHTVIIFYLFGIVFGHYLFGPRRKNPESRSSQVA